LSVAALKSKVILGTVQLGLNYGIHNRSGKPDQHQSTEILRKAYQYGIHLLDSAEAYGDSLKVIGTFLRGDGVASPKFKLVSKFIDDGDNVENKLKYALEELQIPSLYGYLYHQYQDYLGGRHREPLRRLKALGLINNIGVSIYDVAALKEVMHDEDITIIQIPFNIFDCSEEKLELFMKAQSLGKQIHCRSVFLQGLFFLKPEELMGNLIALKQPLQMLHAYASDLGVAVRDLCLNFVLHQSMIDHVIIGVETVRQLDENMHCITESPLVEAIPFFEIQNKTLLNPSNWKF
jgi:aryl-alcohol dehydrogenase-like predicted oxidoreductase